MKILVTLNNKITLTDGRLGPIMTPFEADIDFLIENLKQNSNIIFSTGTKKLSIEFLNTVKETNTRAIQENKDEVAEEDAPKDVPQNGTQNNNNKNKNNWKKEKYNNNNNNTQDIKTPDIGQEEKDTEEEKAE